jgi:hypothetical protein
MSSSSKETQQTQQSQSQPWAPALPLVNQLLGQYGGMSTGVTGDQSDALAGLKSSLSNLPNFGQSGADSISKLFASDSSPQVGMLQSAYGDLKSNLGATASGANLNPYDTPGFSDALKTATDDALNRVKGVYAGSGRDPSGAGSFAGSAARGITQGTAPTIANQYNANVGNMNAANSALFSGAGSTASGITNLRQSDFTNMLAGLQGASSLPGLYASPAAAQLGAANAAYSQPYQNLAQLLQPSVALAGLGTTSSGSGTSTQTSNPSWLDTINSGMGLAGKGMSAASAFLPFMSFSDANLKEDAAPVGKLNDGQTVWSYKYKGDPTPRIGLMAQEVLDHEPEAVGKHSSGFLMVDYDRATKRARGMGGPVGALREAA